MTSHPTHTAAGARKVVVSGSVFVGVVALVVWQRDRLSSLPDVVAHANWIWIGAAVVMQAMSVAALARMQRALLSVAGRRQPIRSILATTYAGNAISQSLPVVGSAASAVFIYRRYVALGVEKISAAWVLMISGVFSTVTFVALSATGALVTGSVGPVVAGLVTLLTGVIPAVVLLAGLQRPGVRRILIRVVDFLVIVIHWLQHSHEGPDTTRGGEIVDQVAGLRLSPRRAVQVGAFAMLNWSGDVACLVFTLMAIGAPVPWHGILLAWAAGAGASSLGLTPGGLGVVEGAYSIALIAAGLPAVLAVSGVLLYRFIKLWMVVGAGGATLLIIRAKARSAGALPVGSVLPLPLTNVVAPTARPLVDEAA